jgi:gas vesicle protein
MSTEKVVLGVLAGAAAGALLGILFAPEKGSDTRKKISRKAEDEVDALKDKMNDFIDVVGQKFEKVKEDVTDFVETAKHKVETEAKQAKA